MPYIRKITSVFQHPQYSRRSSRDLSYSEGPRPPSALNRPRRFDDSPPPPFEICSFTPPSTFSLPPPFWHLVWLIFFRILFLYALFFYYFFPFFLLLAIRVFSTYIPTVFPLLCTPPPPRFYTQTREVAFYCLHSSCPLCSLLPSRNQPTSLCRTFVITDTDGILRLQ